MNPPYSKANANNGKTALYPKFFKKALEVADEVHILMPVNLESSSTMISNVNDLIHRHKLEEPKYVGEHFPSIGLNNIHYVRASRHQDNPVPPKVNPLDKLPELMPERDRLVPILGGLGVDAIPGVTRGGVDVVWKVNKTEGLVTKQIAKDDAYKSRKWSGAKWLLFIGRKVGRQATSLPLQIYKNDPQITWGGWVLAFECNTKAEAIRLRDWLQSDVIVEYVRLMLDAKKTYTVSKDMLRRLPVEEV